MSVTVKYLEVTPEDRECTGWSSRVIAFVEDALRAGHTVTVSSNEEELTPVRMADEVGISRAGIQRRIAAGEISYRKVGNRYRIARSEVERFRAAYIEDMAEMLMDDF